MRFPMKRIKDVAYIISSVYNNFSEIISEEYNKMHIAIAKFL